MLSTKSVRLWDAGLTIAWLALPLILSMACASATYAIGHYYSTDPDLNDRYYEENENRDGSIPPPDLLAPTDHLMSEWGSFISPHWAVCAAHKGTPGSLMKVLVPNELLDISAPGFTPVNFAVEEDIIHPDFNGQLPGSVDLRLRKLADEAEYNGQTISLSEINTNYFRLNTNVVPGTRITMGGFGQTYMGNPLGAKGQRRFLRWGRNRIGIVDETNMSHAFGAPGTPGHLKYEGSALPGDSGSGVFIRDGWEWTVAGYYYTQPGTIIGIQTDLEWIVEQVDDIDLGEPLPDLPLPEADTTWLGYNNDWSTSSLWSDGLPNAESSVWISTPIQVTATTGTVEAGDVFFVSDNSFDGNLTQSGGELEVKQDLFLGPEADDSVTYYLNGGETSAGRVYVGYRGQGAVLQTAGALVADEAVFVGKDNSAASNPSLYLMSGGSLTTSNLNLGFESGSEGQLLLLGQGSPVIDAQRILVGQRGVGTVSQSTGTVSAWYLYLGGAAGSIGSYELSGGSLTVSGDTVVGEQGTATFEQSGGSHDTAKLSVNASSIYELSGGTLSAQKVDVAGTFKPTGGTFDTSELESFVVSGTLDFADSGATLDLARIVDLSDTTITNSTGATISLDSESLLIVDSATKGLIDADQLTVSTSGQPVHEAGTPLFITSHTVRGTGTINDFVAVGESLPAYGELQAAGGPIHLTSGLWKTANAVVDLGSGTLTVTEGRLPGETASIIVDTQAGPFVSSASEAIVVESTGKLTLSGTPTIGGVTNHGVIEVGLGLEEITLDGTVVKGNYVQSGSDSVLIMDLTDNAHDQVNVGFAIVDGSLQLDVDPVVLPDLAIGTQFGLISPDSIIGNEFDEIVYGDASFQEFRDLDMALAVLYENEDFSYGQRVSDGVTVRISIPADFNVDNSVDGLDLAILTDNFGGAASWSQGDADGDGFVTGLDLDILVNYFGWSLGSGGGQGAAVPEPSTLAMLLVGAVFAVAPKRF